MVGNLVRKVGKVHISRRVFVTRLSPIPLKEPIPSVKK